MSELYVFVVCCAFVGYGKNCRCSCITKTPRLSQVGVPRPRRCTGIVTVVLIRPTQIRQSQWQSYATIVVDVHALLNVPLVGGLHLLRAAGPLALAELQLGVVIGLSSCTAQLEGGEQDRRDRLEEGGEGR